MAESPGGGSAGAPARRQRLIGVATALAVVAGGAGIVWFMFGPIREPGCAATADEAYRTYIHELNAGKTVTLERFGTPAKVMSVRRHPIPEPVPVDPENPVLAYQYRTFTVEGLGNVEVGFEACRRGWRVVNEDGLSTENRLADAADVATGELTSVVPMTLRTLDGRDLAGIDRFVATDAPPEPELRLDIGGSDGVPAQSRPANIVKVGNVWDMETDLKGIDLGDAGDRLARGTEKHLRYRNTYVGADGKLVRQYVPMTLGRCVVEWGKHKVVSCPFTIPADAKDAQGRPLVVTPAKTGAGTERPSCEVQAPQPAPGSARSGKVGIDLHGDSYQVNWRNSALDSQSFHEFDLYCGGRHHDLFEDEGRILRGAVPTGPFDTFTIVSVPKTDLTASGTPSPTA